MNEEYPYRYGAIAIIINKNREFLVINDMGFQIGDYDFVGGGREGDETPLENALREVKEEVDLSPEHLRLLGHADHKLSFDFRGGYREFDTPNGKVKYKGQIKDAIVFEFLGEDIDIKPAADHVRGYKWIKADELSTHLNFRGQLEDAMKIIGEVIPEYITEIDEKILR